MWKCQQMSYYQWWNEKAVKHWNQVCRKISKHFVEEVKNIQERKSQNNKLTKEDADQVSNWHRRMNDILSMNFGGQKKYDLLNLLLEIISMTEELCDQHELAHKIAHSMAVDLSKNAPLSELCKHWSRCLEQLSRCLMLLNFYLRLCWCGKII